MSQLPVDLMESEPYPEELDEVKSLASYSWVTWVALGLSVTALSFSALLIMSRGGTNAALTELERNQHANTAMIGEIRQETAVFQDELLEKFSATQAFYAELSQDLQRARLEMEDLHIAQRESNERIQALGERMETMDARTRMQQSQAAQTRQTRSDRASRAPDTLRLISVRSMGPVGWVRLASDDGETSALLQTGDQWREWRFDRLEEGQAVFKVGGSERRLEL